MKNRKEGENVETLNFNTPVRDREGNIVNLDSMSGGGGGGSKTDYTDEETVIGSYLGKPLYRVVRVLETATTLNNLHHNVSELTIDKIIRCDAYIEQTNANYSTTINASSGVDNRIIWYSKDAGELVGNGSYFRVKEIILEYTKTTD